MTPLQKALKEKAVLEAALRIASNEIYFYYHGCPVRKKPEDCCAKTCKVWPDVGVNYCVERVAAHFKAKAEKGGY